jgi:hypothetical protein
MPDPDGPLAMVDPEAITLAFASDPMTLTDGQLDTLVTELRRRRSAFLAAEATKALTKKPRAKPGPAEPAERAAATDTGGPPPTDIFED